MYDTQRLKNRLENVKYKKKKHFLSPSKIQTSIEIKNLSVWALAVCVLYIYIYISSYK
jgi:hypothetical protein